MEPEVDSLSGNKDMVPEAVDVMSVNNVDEMSDTPASPNNTEEMDLMDEISVTSTKNDSLKTSINELTQMKAPPSQTINQNDYESNNDALIPNEKCTISCTNDNDNEHSMRHRMQTVSESEDKLMIDEKVTDANFNDNDESDAAKPSIQTSPNSPEESQTILSPGLVESSEQETPHSPDIETPESPSSTLQELTVETVDRKSPSPPQSPDVSQDSKTVCILNSPTSTKEDSNDNYPSAKDEVPMEVGNESKDASKDTEAKEEGILEMETDQESKCTPNEAKEKPDEVDLEDDTESKDASKDVEENEEEIDLEDGEIEDDEEESKEEVPKPETSGKETVISFKSIIAKEGSEKEKRSRHRDKDKDKEKDSRKDKENKSSDKKRRHEDDSREGKRERRGSSAEKSSRKRARKGSEDVGEIEDDDLLLNVRGASPSKSPTAVVGTKYYGEDVAFGRQSFDDEDGEYGGSSDDRRRRRSRSPLGRRRDDRPSSRRPGSGRNDPIKPANKSDQICAYYMQGKCQKSHEECVFSHNAVPPRKMELCKFWMMDCCAKREKCLYLHNDFPCKFYHTGLVCKAGLKKQCKFSHKPLNEVTKAVLLKHIETAPKEILGDFPRLNRQGALNLISKMEAKINAEIAREKERDEMEHRRRSRWEIPTRDDQQKLHELMEEAGIGNLYDEVQEHPRHERHERHERDRHPNSHHHSRSQSQQQQAPLKPNHGSQNSSLGMLGIPPPIGIPPPGMGLLQNPSVLQPNVIDNPALANVLANLHIPSTTIRPPPSISQETNEREQDVEKEIRSVSPDQKCNSDEPPDHLPPVQKEIFRRLQEQEKKNANKLKIEQIDEEKPDESGWYSSDEDTDKPITDVLKEVSEKADAEKKPPVVDFASVLSAIRKNAAAAAAGNNTSSNNLSETTILGDITGRGDVDFRFPNTSSQNNQEPPGANTKQGPFGDMDFRVPAMRPEFKDIDLRLTGSPTNNDRRSPTSLFKSLPTGPATMIDASINSHPPMTWKVHVVGGVKKPDYNYVRHTLTAAQIALDPRFGPRTGGISILPEPGSPPSASKMNTSASLLPPTTIPGGEAVMDPRMNRRTSAAVSDPRLSSDPRSLPINPHVPIQSQPPSNLMPPNLWPNSNDMTQAAIAAQFMAASQLGLLGPYPSAGGIPFAPPEFSAGGMPGSHPSGLPSGLRPGFHGGPRVPASAPPSSSWERYHSQQQSGGLTPPI